MLTLMTFWWPFLLSQYQEKLPPQPLLYALELLTVYAWEQGCQAEDFNMAQGIRAVLQLISQPTNLCVYWTVNYNFEDKTVQNILLYQLNSPRYPASRSLQLQARVPLRVSSEPLLGARVNLKGCLQRRAS